jgi:hypothetical protein
MKIALGSAAGIGIGYSIWQQHNRNQEKIDHSVYKAQERTGTVHPPTYERSEVFMGDSIVSQDNLHIRDKVPFKIQEKLTLFRSAKHLKALLTTKQATN